MWPTLLGGISFILSGQSSTHRAQQHANTNYFLALTLRAFYRRRLEFTQFLSTHSSLSMSRYIRLMMLALSEMMCTVPISIYSTYISNKGVPLQPWVSWADTHYDFSYVGQVPAVVWRSDPNYRIAVELTRWLFPASAFLFFLLFGFGAEARKNYCATFLRVVKCLGYNSASEAPGNVIPQYVIFLHHFFRIYIRPVRWKSGFNKNISVGSFPVYVTTAPHAKPADPFIPSAAKRFTIDIEKAAGCSSPSLSNYSPQGQQPSPTATCAGGDTDESGTDVPNSAPSRACPTGGHTVPAYHRPFSLPNVCPIPPRELQTSRSIDSVRITVQTQYSTVV